MVRSRTRTRLPADVIVILLDGEIDITRRDELLRQLAAVQASICTNLAVQMRTVTYLDCAALSVLMRMQRATAAKGGTAFLLGVQPAVRRVLDITGASEAFRIQ